jgi:predicted lipid carrier protein YhbT
VSPAADRTVPPGLPAWLAPTHRRLAAWVEKLPSAPPSFLLARLLDRVLLPRLPTDARTAMTGRCIELRVSDFGLRVRLQLTASGFAPAGDRSEAVLCIRAASASYLRLLRGQDDPDQLFFERALVMEGDTELGLVLKNTLDAIGPLWPKPAPTAKSHPTPEKPR